MAKTFDATQTSIVASDVKVEISWLFEIDTDNDGTPEYYYSTKAKTYAAQPYTAKIMEFKGITMQRNTSEAGISAPNKLNFSVSNASNTLNASSFEGADVTVKLVMNDGSNETIICTWSFEVIHAVGYAQSIKLTCRDWLQKYIDGDHPNGSLVGDLWPSNDPKQHDFCVPKIYGEAFIPVPSVYITDKRYYILGAHSESLGSEDLTNGGFENAGGGGADIWANWTENASDGALANETTVVHGGSDAAKITAGSSVDTYVKQTFTPTTGRLHKLVFWARGDGTHSIRYQIEDDTNTEDIVALTSAGVTAAEYTQVTVYFTVPYNCTSVNIYFYCPNTDTAYGYVDDVSIKPDEQYTISKARSPREHSSASVWTTVAGYKFEYYRKQGSDNNYYIAARYILIDSDNDGTCDDNILFKNGETFLPCPTKYTDANTSSYTNPGDWINQILQDMGVPSAKIDSSTLTTVKGVFSGWGLTFNGGFWYKQNKKKLLAKLIQMCNLELIVRDKIYFKVHSKTSKKTITKAYVHKGTFKISPLTMDERKDSGYVAHQVNDEPIDVMIKLLVPATGSTTDYISNDTVPADFIQDDQDAQAIGTLALQRKLMKKHKISFTSPTFIIDLEPDDVITIDEADYGDEGSTYDVLVDEMRYDKEGFIDFTCTRFSCALNDFGDLSPGDVTLATDDSTTVYEPIVQGPPSTLAAASKPNAITETVYVESGGDITAKSGANVIFEAGADLIFKADATNPGTIYFEGTSYTVLFGPDPTDATGTYVRFSPEDAGDSGVPYLYIGTETRLWHFIRMYSDRDIYLRAEYSSGEYAFLRCYSGSDAQVVNLQCDDGTTDYGVRFWWDGSILAFEPTADQAVDCGVEDRSWDDIWYKTAHDEADYFLLDDRDDLALICQIKGSGVIDERTGLEIIDDNTLPEILLSKIKKDKLIYDSDNLGNMNIIGEKKKGDIAYNSKGKPFINNTVLKSLFIGCIKQLNQKVVQLEQQVEILNNRGRV